MLKFRIIRIEPNTVEMLPGNMKAVVLFMLHQEVQTESTAGEILLCVHRQTPCYQAAEELEIMYQQHLQKLKEDRMITKIRENF